MENPLQSHPHLKNQRTIKKTYLRKQKAILPNHLSFRWLCNWKVNCKKNLLILFGNSVKIARNYLKRKTVSSHKWYKWILHGHSFQLKNTTDWLQMLKWIQQTMFQTRQSETRWCLNSYPFSRANKRNKVKNQLTRLTWVWRAAGLS